MDGIVSINKTTGMTSHDVVARVRRLTRQRRVGHAGTLDPLAEGVLPVCLGQATRVVEYLGASGKAYRATIRFGAVTATYDAEGAVVRTAPVRLSRDEIAAALPALLGEQWQTPPIYSAIKRGGRPLYELARAGAAVTPEPRRVRIEALDIVAWELPDLVLDVVCGSGTYIRSLAYDLGERLGPGAYLAALRRTRSGPFTLRESVTLEALARALEDGTWADHLYAVDEGLLGWPAAILGPASEVRLRTGQPLGSQPHSGDAASGGAEVGADDERPDGQLARAYSSDGRFLGILSWQAGTGRWQPRKVLPSEPVEA